MKNKLDDVMIVFHDFRLGGIQRKVIDICNHLNKKHIKTSIILRYKKGIFLSKIPKNIPVVAPSIHTKKLDMLYFTLWLTFHLAKQRPSTIICFVDLSSVPVLIAKKILFWYHPRIIVGEDILTSKHVYSETRPKMRLFLIKHLYPLATKIFVQTTIQKDDLANIIGKKYLSKIIITPNWLPMHFKKVEDNVHRSIDILYVGRIEDQKNIPEFINIIRLVKKDNPFINAHIIGSGSKTKAINNLIKKYNLQSNIVIKKPSINIEKIYLASKIFLITSNYEGFPLTILEAISYGCHPIVKNIPELKTFFKTNKNSFIYKNPIIASKMVNHTLKNPDSLILNKYQNIVLKQQSTNFSKFFQSI